jgi:hypothetical protein
LFFNDKLFSTNLFRVGLQKHMQEDFALENIVREVYMYQSAFCTCCGMQLGLEHQLVKNVRKYLKIKAIDAGNG